MHPSLEPYAAGIEIGNASADNVAAFFFHNNDPETLAHTRKVAEHAREIAVRIGSDPALAERAALLHDVSNVVPKAAMLELAERLSLCVLEEERAYPRIVHQKLSMAMARDLFGVRDDAVLQAIECHTTLKAGAGELDKILFVADKVSWELPGKHPYQAAMRERLARNDLDGAVLVYLDHVWSQRDQLRLVHPWLIAARAELQRAAEGS
ncbi:bis(5'-nucleosyl)-tetraphosphatase (symmetrical) YqeK [Paenibacillus sp.]|uniref:bis(5'-nucleosyl)-tetraphosphatase (symmetrical) YqeK n=1 Tax=Paenibacillus sp. TaxID=58172 RepID=UPI002D3B6A81|nr:bis(5'-nucleosyl)-tetraphosphatase (symmetrical) YqeK [Paenibacillus sp.]HZG56627.1 bis(5'-nucleosyl)-tetraphosphatase (symmetrical) YqeK [Paenibacillus sp.]